MQVDPVTLEVFRNRFDVIAQEMQTTMLKSGYSIILKEGADASSAFFSSEGDVIAQAASHPIHLAALLPAVRRTMEEFPPETMADGDVYCMNDPYDGGTHIPDLIVTVPIYYDGQLVALGVTLAHHQDFGGKAPGSMVTDATEIFQEGLIVPPIKLYDRGELNTTFVKMLRRNVRIPDEVFGDIMAQVAAGKTATRRVRELIDQYGAEMFLAVIPRLLDHAEALTRRAIEQIPDGTYTFEDYLDNDGIDLDRRIPIRATVTVKGSEVLIDFTGTSPQVRGPANTAPTGALAGAFYVIRAITDPDIPNNSGCYRPVKLHIPEGSLLNPRHPAPVSIRAHTLKRVVDTLLGAFAQALPDRVPAASHGGLLAMSLGGLRADTGKPFVYMECNAGGTGAVRGRDGVDNMDTDINNARNIPAEAAELEYPLRIWKNKLRRDSGGAGRQRGGLGTERVIELLEGEVLVSHRDDRHFTQPWGLFGGRAGASFRTVVRRTSGETEEIPARKAFVLRAGDRIEAYTGGGGGYDDPLERESERVLADVRDRKVSLEAAYELYGVVLDPQARAVDVAATARRRRALAATRGPVRGVFDRGGPQSVAAQPAAR